MKRILKLQPFHKVVNRYELCWRSCNLIQYDDAEKLLRSVERTATTVRVNTSTRKTEPTSFNQESSICFLDGNRTKKVGDFVHFGSNIHTADKDLDIRKVKALSALNKYSCV